MIANIGKVSTAIHYSYGNKNKTGIKWEKKPETGRSSSDTMSLSSMPEINAFQQYESLSSGAAGMKERVNSCRYMGDSMLTEQQISELVKKYDVDNPDSSSTSDLLNELADMGVITEEDRLFALDETAPVLIGGGAFVYNPNVPFEKRRSSPNLSMEFLVNGNPGIESGLVQKMQYCTDVISWFSDENNKGINQFEEVNCQRLQQYHESCEKVLNVLNELRQFSE